MRACKLCFIGEPGVGKTSLAQRLLHDRFPAQPTGPGIHVAAHRFRLASGAELPATVWDVAAASAIDTLSQAYLTGVDAVVAVAAAGDDSAARRALALVAQVRQLHPQVTSALWLSKSDLDAGGGESVGRPDVPSHRVSARDGDGVAQAIGALLARVAARR
jgi:GTPase SAR1 family protein